MFTQETSVDGCFFACIEPFLAGAETWPDQSPGYAAIDYVEHSLSGVVIPHIILAFGGVAKNIRIVQTGL